MSDNEEQYGKPLWWGALSTLQFMERVKKRMLTDLSVDPLSLETRENKLAFLLNFGIPEDFLLELQELDWKRCWSCPEATREFISQLYVLNQGVESRISTPRGQRAVRRVMQNRLRGAGEVNPDHLDRVQHAYRWVFHEEML